VRKDNDMQRFKNILFIAAPDSVGGVALECAATLAVNNQARLTVVRVIEEMPLELKLVDRVLSADDLQAEIVAKHRQKLEEQLVAWNKDIEIEVKVLIGKPFLQIIREVLRSGADLVVKMAESGAWLDRVFGSDDMHLLRKCPCPVWLVKSDSPKAYQRILAAVDVDDLYPPEELNTRYQLNLQVLEIASSLALSEFAELHIVHAWKAIGEGEMRSGFIKSSEDEVVAYVESSEDEVVAYVEEVRQQHKQNLEELVDGIMSKLGRNTSGYLKPKTHLLKGYAGEDIPVLAREIKADLVVMGTIARTGISGFIMGNTAETILNRLDCSVLAIKPPGFETPITLDD
jgi:nucleotide-binding universal stress UspA family protein